MPVCDASCCSSVIVSVLNVWGFFMACIQWCFFLIAYSSMVFCCSYTYLFSPGKGSCYVFSSWNYSCNFLTSDRFNLHLSSMIFLMPGCGASCCSSVTISFLNGWDFFHSMYLEMLLLRCVQFHDCWSAKLYGFVLFGALQI